MRKTSKILALVLSIALFSAPLAWAAPGVGSLSDDRAPAAFTNGILAWFQEAVSSLLGAEPQASDGLMAAPAATESGSTETAGDGPIGGPTAQAGITIDPNG